MPIRFRPYVAGDAAATLEVFRRAIHTTAAVDYSPDQIESWAPADVDVSAWERKRAERLTAVADDGGTVVGFTDVDHDGYIDMLFVDPAVGRRGVATSLVTWAAQRAESLGARFLRTSASITARPFFIAQGFVVDEERRPVVRGVAMPNYAMGRSLAPTTPVPTAPSEHGQSLLPGQS